MDAIASQEPARPIKHAPSAIERLARFTCETAIGDTLRRQAVPMILDTLAVTVAGSQQPAARNTASAFAPAESGGVPCLWSGEAYRDEDAALIFGTASHVLDYDDVAMLTVCHPSAPVLSAALAARPWSQVSGADLVDALLIGTEVGIRTGQVMGFRHYELGFHATSTLGTLGAAAAVSRLMALDKATTAHALSIAASMASGLRMNFGSMVKSMHVGIAASNGLRAAKLAAAGIEGSPDVFEKDGFLHAFTGGISSHWPDEIELGRPFAIENPGFEQKRYPCCYMVHKAIEGTLALREEGGISINDVTSMRVVYPIGGTKPLIHPFPRTGLNALFSAPYAVMAALADGAVNLRSFTDEAVIRPKIQERLTDVEVVEEGAPGAAVGAAPVTVEIRLTDGRILKRTVKASPGSLDDPMTMSQLEAKWLDCLSVTCGDSDQSSLRDAFAQGLRLAEQPRLDRWLGGVRDLVVKGNA